MDLGSQASPSRYMHQLLDEELWRQVGSTLDWNSQVTASWITNNSRMVPKCPELFPLMEYILPAVCSRMSTTHKMWFILSAGQRQINVSQTDAIYKKGCGLGSRLKHSKETLPLRQEIYKQKCIRGAVADHLPGWQGMTPRSSFRITQPPVGQCTRLQSNVRWERKKYIC